jgi:hypothetical protein
MHPFSSSSTSSNALSWNRCYEFGCYKRSKYQANHLLLHLICICEERDMGLFRRTLYFQGKTGFNCCGRIARGAQSQSARLAQKSMLPVHWKQANATIFNQIPIHTHKTPALTPTFSSGKLRTQEARSESRHCAPCTVRQKKFISFVL